MAMPTSLSSSSSANQWTPDVFLSFRGEDTRKFTGHLYKALHEKKIETFIDSEKLMRGQEIATALIQAINKSRIAIVIFSKDYASSRFCLDELVMIMDCLNRKTYYRVLPVFYEVDPTDVRHQKGSFKEALAKHETRNSEKGKVQKWRSALEKAANIAGWTSEEYGQQEYKLIERIVEEVSEMINDRISCVANYPVGSRSTFRKKAHRHDDHQSIANSPFKFGTSVPFSGLQTSPSASGFGAQSSSAHGIVSDVATMAMPTSLSSSSSANQWTPDVFLSFGGIGTRNNFTGCLYKALREKEISTFMDDDPRKGEEIKPALIKAIKDSRIAIVIFSKDYASSRFCLDELVMIMDCLDGKRNYRVLPVFYDVHPANVRHQKGSFKEAMAKHETRNSEKGKVQKWRSALEKAANIPGLSSKQYGQQECKLIERIVEDVSKMINDRTSCVANYPVGSGSTFEEKAHRHDDHQSMANSPFKFGTSVPFSGLQTSPSASGFGAQSSSAHGIVSVVATMAMPTSLSSSSSANQWTPDVFLSFEGIRTRNNFTGCLYKALREKEISTFMEDDPRKGEEIKPSLIKAIKDSRIAIVIFSKDYASSRFCLDELVMIMDCLDGKRNYRVLPVFYDVHPANVRHQKGSFEEALAKHETRNSEKGKVQKWRSALEKAANIPGLISKQYGQQEYKLIERIVEDVSKMINDRTSCVSNYPVG